MKTKKAAVAAPVCVCKDTQNWPIIKRSLPLDQRKAVALKLLKEGRRATAVTLNRAIGFNDARKRFTPSVCVIVGSSIGWKKSLRIVIFSAGRRTHAMNKLRYQKPQAVKELERLALEHFRREHPNFPEYAIAPQSYRDDTANGLTRCVVDFIRYNGGQAERINTTGMPEQRGGRIIWRKSNTTKGSADISATIGGRTVRYYDVEAHGWRSFKVENFVTAY